jgi:dihydroorotate dehydrogenase (fumarate)
VRSSGNEYHDSLRWISILYNRIPCQFAASSGVHDADAALKLVAAGAQVVQICSLAFRKGYSVAGDMNAAMSARLDSFGMEGIDALRGRFAQWQAPDPSAYLRLQYIQALTGIS